MGQVIELRTRQPLPVTVSPRARRAAQRQQEREAALRQAHMMLASAFCTTALLMLALGLLARA